MFKEDTIAAIATPTGYGGISIIRISGKDTFETVNKLFKSKSGKSFLDFNANSIHYGHIINPENNEIVDEVLISKMTAPYTYTTEDTAEINCHGGLSCAKSILNLLLNNGIHLAESGEFTKRAFLNGRIDLVQAEAISDIITSKTDKAAKAAVDTLNGNLSDAINEIKQNIVKLLSNLEVTIQYPEYDIEDVTNKELEDILITIKEKINKILSSFKKGEILKEGFKVVIAGKPNVGKSMLLNTLINENKAIVTDIPGTTRDVVDEYININGIPIRIYDTAGIRETKNKVEQIGVDRSKEMILKSDFVLFVVDASKELSTFDMEIFNLIPKDKPMTVVLNKTDLTVNNATLNYFKNKKTINISALNKTGIDILENTIIQAAEKEENNSSSDILLSNIRHKQLLESSLTCVENAISSLNSGNGVDLVEIDIMDCLDNLGKITGECTSEDIIDEIFANFCLGK